MTGFSASISGLQNASLRQAVSANNVANISTNAYRARRVYNAEAPNSSGTTTSAITSDSRTGGIEHTNQPLDMMVAGRGFFAIEDASGAQGYTREGSFSPDSEGFLSNSRGERLSPAIRIPEDSVSVSVSASGEVVSAGADGANTAVGNIRVVDFPNQQGLVGGGVKYASAASGAATEVDLSTSGTAIVSGALETSNVELTREIPEQMSAVHTLKSNIAAIKTQDEMLGTLMDMKA